MARTQVQPLQGMRGGAHPVLERAQQVRACPAEPLDGRVRIGGEHGVTAAGEHPDEPVGGGGGVLEVVHEHDVQPFLLPREEVGILLENARCAVHELGRVEGVGHAQGADLLVLRPERCRAAPLRAPEGLRPAGQDIGRQAVFVHAVEQLAQLAPEAAGPEGLVQFRGPHHGTAVPGGVTTHHLREERVLLGPGQQHRHGGDPGQQVLGLGAAQDVERVRLPRAHERRADGGAGAAADLVPQRGGEFSRRREHEQALRIGTLRDPPHRTLHGHGAATGPGRAQHQDGSVPGR